MMCILLIAERASVEATEGFLIVRPAMGTIEFAANVASRVALVAVRRSASEGSKKEPRPKAGAQVNRNPVPSASPLGTLVPALMASLAKFSTF